MMKSVLAASAVLVALCSAASAREVVHHPYMAQEAAVRISEVHPNSFAYAAPTEGAGYDMHQYHGGPKAND
jgi:opacity protein-like surface antigen